MADKTLNMIGIPYGVKQDFDKPSEFIRDTISAIAGADTIYEGVKGGQGSAAFHYNWQTIFIDNSANAYPVTIKFIGSLSVKTIGARKQGFLPCACPLGSFSFTISTTSPTKIDIPFELWSYPIEPHIWGDSDAAGGVTDNTGAKFNPDGMAQTFAYYGDGTLQTITATDGASTWVQTYTWIGGKVSTISKWIKS